MTTAHRIAAPSPEYVGPSPHVMHDGAGKPLDNMPVQQIVIHATVTPCEVGDRYAVARGFTTSARQASAHYVVDPGGVVQVVFDSLVAEHCGHNPNTIGVELCDPQAGQGSRWADANHADMLRKGANLVARLCLAYGVPIRRLTVAQLRDDVHGICGHVDVTHAFPGVTDHTDPGVDFPWETFMAAVQKHAAYLIRKQKGAGR
jgi:N-acetyl-anhydromuramyl-L-alanine amidase AmpD